MACPPALRPEQALEWVVYPEEGHGWFNLKTQEDFWGRVERFLARHIGPDAVPAPGPAASGPAD